jgi:uncharacterized protein YkwD
MNTKTIGLLLALLLPMSGQAFANTVESHNPAQSALSPSPNWKREIIDTTSEAAYRTQEEREVIIEINMMRTDPAMYARTYLVPLREYFEGTLLHYPGEIAMVTNEGASPLEECIRELECTQPLPPLSPRKGLVLAARDHTVDQGRTGQIGHTGSDGSSFEARVSRYGKWQYSAGENISYGYQDARKIVIALLVDDGVPTRGHRKNLLHKNFNVVGVEVGPHREYREMCVMDFAGEYVSK